ncbi:HAD-IB family phosphatase [Candidatus Woesearchaeota archaeon]|nr:HAD-IB family phosphatase [Candidatus Woesearchaeota archaeon]
MDNHIKLVFCDMEGTLFKKLYKDSKGNTAPSSWELLAEHLGPEAHAKDEATKDTWNRGGFAGFVEWMEASIKIHKEYGLTKEFFQNVMSSIQYNPGVKEAFEEFKRRGYKTALISGGFKAQADRAQRDLKIDHSFAACEYFWNEKGEVEHWNLLPCDYEGKVDFMKLIMREHELTAEECAFIGDGKNDIPLARAVGTSIAFNAAPELQQVTTYAVNQPEGQEDFKEVLDRLS